MKKYQKFLVLRYSTNIDQKIIELHQEQIIKNGYCWFGKIGSFPSDGIMKAVVSEEEPAIVLFKKGFGYYCRLGGVTQEKPESGCPDYYHEKKLECTAYFKLLSIEPMPLEEMEKCTVVSTGSFVLDAMYHSRIPFLLACYGDINISKEDAEKYENGLVLGANDCRYRKKGICNLKCCLGYKLECDRPSSCPKQKR